MASKKKKATKKKPLTPWSFVVELIVHAEDRDAAHKKAVLARQAIGANLEGTELHPNSEITRFDLFPFEEDDDEEF
jgi:hypothetical protein